MQAIPGGELALDRRERLLIPYEDPPVRPVDERVCDFAETAISLTPERARLEASRCIHCPDPAACVEACPADNDIPSAMWLIEQGDFLGAAELYRRTSNMPEICGRVCPHETLCQYSCVRNKYGEPVLTGALEAFVADFQRQAGAVPSLTVDPPTHKQVAVVGSGPSGLACAEQLLEEGHAVFVYEAAPVPGGLLEYGIPNFKLPKDVVDAKIDQLSEAGVRFVTNTRVGKDITVDNMLADGCDAVYVAVGTGIDARMSIPGEDLPGVYQATDFLVRANVPLEKLPEDKRQRPVVGEKVLVVGGGDTASDCLRSALRIGAKEVTCIYRRTEAEMPGSVHDRHLAREEGAQYHFLVQPVKLIPGEDGRVGAVECLQCELGEPDASGRRRPIPIEGSNFTIEADTVILAIGYWPDPLIGETTTGLKTHKWGLIVADPATGQTSRPEIFAGGDAVTGPDLVVTAMVAGRRAARAIHKYLSAN